MQRNGSVVVGYDGSGRALAALKWAAREAACRGLPLRVIRVVPYAATLAPGPGPVWEHSDPAGSHVLDEGIQIASLVLNEGQISGMSITGHAAGVLAEAADRASLVVVGQRSQDTPVSSAIGSTSLVLADHARCPVVIARGATGPERGVLPVVVSATGDASSQAALDFAAHTAQMRGVPLTIVAAWSLPPAREWSRPPHGFETVAQWARDLCVRAVAAANASEDHVRQGYPTVATRTRVDQLDPAVALVRTSRRAGLVVVGFGSETGTAVRREGTVAVQGLGKGAQAVLARAACPVAVVPDVAVSMDEGGDG
jgi:nucleotide-binding universal stress UspA family protein